MRLASIALVLLLPLGCAIRAWPPAFALGNAGACGSFAVTTSYNDQGDVVSESETWSDCLAFGGPISEQGAALVKGAANGARKAAGAALGAPVP